MRSVLNPGVFDLGVLQLVCGLVRGLRSCHPLPVACGLCHPHRHWPRGPQPHAPTGPCHCALRPWYWVLTPGRLRLVRTLQAVCRRTMTVGALIFQSFTRDVQTTFCLDLLVLFFRLVTMRATDVCPSRSGYGSATRFQRWICRMVMRTIAPCTRFDCRYVGLVCIACMNASSVQRCLSGRWRHQAPAAVPRTHALHVPITACNLYPRAWSLRAPGLALDQRCWLDVW